MEKRRIENNSGQARVREKDERETDRKEAENHKHSCKEDRIASQLHSPVFLAIVFAVEDARCSVEKQCCAFAQL